MRWLCIATSALWLACASATPPPTQYLLRDASLGQSGRVEAPQWIALGSVRVAPYLRTTGIVVETEPGQVRAARSHEWAEPLEAGLRSTLGTGLSAALGYPVSDDASGRSAWDYRVDVAVDRLHGSMTGSALLTASYRIERAAEAGDAVEYRFAETLSLPREGYAGVVAAETALVRQLAGAIAASLRELGAP